MALDSLNIGAPGPASAFPGAPSSSALGPDADILAFLQAMVDASTLADADVVALATAAPAQAGDTTGATGTSPARAVVPPWEGAIDAKLLALLAQHAPTAIPTDTPNPADVPPATDPLTRSAGEVVEHFVRSRFGNASSADLPAEPSVSEPDDSEAEAAAFLLMVATLPQSVPAPPIAALPSDAANTESENHDTSGAASQGVSGAPSSVTDVTTDVTGVAAVAPLVGGVDAGAAQSTARGSAESAGDRSPGAASKLQAAADVAAAPQGASAHESAGTRASSPRVQAFLRAMQQSKALSLSATAENAAQQMYADMAAAPMESDELSTERALWTAAAAERPPVAPAPERSLRDTLPTPTDSRPATDPLPVRSQLTAAVVSRLLEDTLSSSTGGRHTGDRESSLFGGHRPQTLAAAKDVASTALFALPSQFDVSAAAALTEAMDPPAGAQARLPNEDAVASTLVRSMHWQYRNGVGTAVVQLDPGYLGPVRIALHVEGGTVSATLHAANAEVRAWVLANESALRQSLSTQGLALDRLVVADDDQLEQYASPDRRGQGEQQEQDRPRPRRAPQPDEGRIFEIVV